MLLTPTLGYVLYLMYTRDAFVESSESNNQKTFLRMNDFLFFHCDARVYSQEKMDRTILLTLPQDNAFTVAVVYMYTRSVCECFHCATTRGPRKHYITHADFRARHF